MRVDHVLAHGSLVPGAASLDSGPTITACRRLDNKFASDHFGILFIIALPKRDVNCGRLVAELEAQASPVPLVEIQPTRQCTAHTESTCTCPDHPSIDDTATLTEVFDTVRTVLIESAVSQDEYRVNADSLQRDVTTWFPKRSISNTITWTTTTPRGGDEALTPSPDVAASARTSGALPDPTQDDLADEQASDTGSSPDVSDDDADVVMTSTTTCTIRATGRNVDAEAPPAEAAAALDDTEMLRRFARLSTLVNTMPEVNLSCGQRHTVGTILFDSGARANLITHKFAMDCGATWVKGPTVTKNTPRFILADGSQTRPTGLVRVKVHLPETSPIDILAWVMPNGPCELIFGSESMRENGCIIDYETLQICFRRQLDDQGTSISYVDFRSETTQRNEAAASLYATTDIHIPRGHQILVPVNASQRTHLAQGTWGLVSNTGAADTQFLVAKGCLTLHRDTNWVQVMNMADTAISIRRGELVAYLHRHDRCSITISDCDLDEVSREADLPPRSAAPGDTATTAAAAASMGRASNDPTSIYSSKRHLDDITLGDTGQTNLTRDELDAVKSKILQYDHLWDKDAAKQPKAHGVECDIQITGKPTMHARHRNVNPVARQQISKIIKEQKDAGIIQDSCSPYSSTVLLVPKPGGGVRFCVDFRNLNKIVKRDAYPLPRVEDSLAALHGNKFFSSIDIVTAFWQVPLSTQSRELTAFATPDGLYEYLRMPMGLATASGVFSKFIDEVFKGLKWHCILTYIDDVLIYTSTFEKHMTALDAVFNRLDEHGLTLGAKKCHFCTSSVRFLGHVVSLDGIHPDPSKIAAIDRLSLDDVIDKKGLRALMGIFGYYRKFCKAYSTVATPLTSCLKDAYRLPRTPGSLAINWTPQQRTAFTELKRMLTSDTMLAHPDWTKPFTIDTDACGHGLGAVLSQLVDGKEQVVAYASRSLADNEKKYTIWELETLAVVWAIDLYGWYLWNSPFTVRTDANAVEWVLQKATTGRLMRWALNLQEREFTILHRKGSANGNADSLSRCPLRSSCPYGETAVEPIHGVAPPLHASAAYFGKTDAEAWNGAELAALQLKDPWCKPIMSRLRKSDDVEPTTTAGTPYVLHADGSLWIRIPTPTSRSRGVTTLIDVVVVPESLKAFTLRRHHGLPMSGHAGTKKTLAKLRLRFWWKHMNRDVKRWISACLVCRKRKTPRPSNTGVPKSVCTSTHPFHTVAIDLVGPAMETPGGNKYILTMLDIFTRWVVAVPIPSKKAHVIAHAIYRNWICKYGCMERVYSDRGTEFVNGGLESMCKRWSIRQIKTTGWQPQANPVERIHRWLNSSMTTMNKVFGDDWDHYVDPIVFAFNTSEHESTGFSPYNLVYGRQPRMPEDIIYNHVQLNYKDEDDLHIKCSRWLASAYQHAIKQQTTMAAKNRACRDRKFRRATFSVGDFVLYWQPGNAAEQARKSNKDTA